MKHFALHLTVFLSFLFIGMNSTQGQEANREFYQLKLYHFSDEEQEAALDDYLSRAYIPALHRAGIEMVGAFKPIGNDTATDKRIYILLPISSPDQLIPLSEKLQLDPEYVRLSRSYREAPYDDPPYDRIESMVLRAFSMAPVMTIPHFKSEKKERVYELRSYESATEKLHQNKVHMFNEGGEISLFERLGFNAIFYGEVVAGSRMPNLMYMTSFENMKERDAHWQAFRVDSEWKILSAKPEYQNNVSRNEQILTHPAEYSDF